MLGPKPRGGLISACEGGSSHDDTANHTRRIELKSGALQKLATRGACGRHCLNPVPPPACSMCDLREVSAACPLQGFFSLDQNYPNNCEFVAEIVEFKQDCETLMSGRSIMIDVRLQYRTTCVVACLGGFAGSLFLFWSSLRAKWICS